MPAPTITALPDAPSRLDEPLTFIAKADAFVEALALFRSETNAVADYLEALESGTLSEKLAAIDALTWAADKLVYLTGTNTVASADLTSVARTLLAQTTQALMRTAGLGLSANGSSLVSAADYAAMRALLGLVVGTDVQAYSAYLASLTSAAALKPVESLIIACSDETTAITAGNGKATFRMPYAFTLSAVRASVGTAPTGSTIIIDINEGGSTILSTKLSIDASEKTSTTAASAAVISDTALADDAEITIDFDQVGSTIAGAGVKVTLIGSRT